MPKIIDIILDPEKYGYKQCDHCNGYGSSFMEDTDTCTKCHGKGLVPAPPVIDPE